MPETEPTPQPPHETRIETHAESNTQTTVTDGTEATSPAIRGYVTLFLAIMRASKGAGLAVTILLFIGLGMYILADRVTIPQAKLELELKKADMEARRVEAAAYKKSQEEVSTILAVTVAANQKLAERQTATVDKIAFLAEKTASSADAIFQVEAKQNEWQNAWKIEIEDQHRQRAKESATILDNQRRLEEAMEQRQKLRSQEHATMLENQKQFQAEHKRQQEQGDLQIKQGEKQIQVLSAIGDKLEGKRGGGG
jgi:hypothetical protein